MGTIRTSVQMFDGVTGPARGMVNVMRSVVGAFESVQAASASSVDVGAVRQARDELARLEVSIEQTEAEIRKSTTQQDKFTNSIHQSGGAASGLLSKFKGIVATVGGMMGIQKILGLSDQMAGAKARLNLIVDDGGSVAELEQKIFASAQRSRAGYLDTMQSVSKIGLLAGKSFSGNDEMIKFAELMNKNFIIAGASAQEQSSAMYQLNQALGSGRLQGDEYRSIIENAPLLAKAIESYMRNSGVTGTMKEWSADGLLTAEVIKAALFNSADEIEDRFNKMPKTWGQIWSGMKNTSIMMLDPLLTKINEIANSDRFAGLTNGLISAFGAVASVLGFIFGLMVTVGSTLYENWAWLEPLITGAAVALGGYLIVLGLFNAAQAISNGLKALSIVQAVAHGAAVTAEMAATAGMTASQLTLNAALYACPLTWILLIIIAVVAAFYAAIGAVNHFAGTTLSATGIICGAFMVALAFIGNLFVGLLNVMTDAFALVYNLIATVANFIGNVFTDPVGAVARLFFGLADTVLGVLQTLAGAVDAVFGSSLAASVQGWRDSLGGWVDAAFGKGPEIMAKMNTDDISAMKLDRFEYDAAFDLGNGFGKGLDEKVGKMFDFDTADTMGELQSGIGETAGNTARMANALEISEEDLAYLRDIAERDAINRFTTAEVKIEQHNENHIASELDVDGIMDKWTEGFVAKMDVSGEGVHE